MSIEVDVQDFNFPPTMNIYAKDGDKAIFTGENGRDSENALARDILTIGETYTVEHTEVGQSYTAVYFYEHPGKGFNSVMFVDAPKEGVTA